MGQEIPDPRLLNEWLSKVTYKKGWTFKIVLRDDSANIFDFNSFILRIFIETIDSNSGEPRTIVTQNIMHPIIQYSENHFWSFVYDRIHEAETHESREFFRVNGEKILDPHYDDGTDKLKADFPY